MDFSDACAFVMPLGKHKGSTIARIGSNSEGLKYLDWLIGQTLVSGPLKTVLSVYLKHPAIAMQLDSIFED